MEGSELLSQPTTKREGSEMVVAGFEENMNSGQGSQKGKVVVSFRWVQFFGNVQSGKTLRQQMRGYWENYILWTGY